VQELTHLTKTKNNKNYPFTWKKEKQSQGIDGSGGWGGGGVRGDLQDAISLLEGGCEVKRRMVALIYRDFEDMVYMEGKKCERILFFFIWRLYICIKFVFKLIKPSVNNFINSTVYSLH